MRNSVAKTIKEEASGIEVYHRHIKKKFFILTVLIVLTFILVVLAINAGAANMNPLEVLKTLFGQSGEKASIVIWRIRMPRVIAALVAGAGLAIAGCVMQTTLKNPLASPSTLGISNAAAFGANVAIIGFGAGTILQTAGDAVSISNPYLVTICSFVCSMATILLILSLSNMRGFSPSAIVLSGVALGSIFSAGTTIIQYFAASDIKIAAAIFWTFGDLGRATWGEVLILSIIAIASVFYFFLKRWDYNALANGEETAKSLGVDTKKIRFWSLLIASLITAVAVSFLGIIGFIGLVAPQAMRRILGADHRFLIPASALAGAVILLAADILARSIISPIILPVGAITSILGGPMFLFLLMKERKSTL